eukprot:g11348.t1
MELGVNTVLTRARVQWMTYREHEADTETRNTAKKLIFKQVDHDLTIGGSQAQQRFKVVDGMGRECFYVKHWCCFLFFISSWFSCMYVRNVPDMAEGALIYQIKTLLLEKRLSVDHAGVTVAKRAAAATKLVTQRSTLQGPAGRRNGTPAAGSPPPATGCSQAVSGRSVSTLTKNFSAADATFSKVSPSFTCSILYVEVSTYAAKKEGERTIDVHSIKKAISPDWSEPNAQASLFSFTGTDGKASVLFERVRQLDELTTDEQTSGSTPLLRKTVEAKRFRYRCSTSSFTYKMEQVKEGETFEKVASAAEKFFVSVETDCPETACEHPDYTGFSFKSKVAGILAMSGKGGPLKVEDVVA